MRKMIWMFLLFAIGLPGENPVEANEVEKVMDKMAKRLAGNLPVNVQRPLPVVVIYSGTQSINNDRSEQLAGALSRLTDFQVLERDPVRISQYEDELDFALTDLVDQTQRLTASKMIGAKAFVYGKSTRNEKEERLAAWILLLESGTKLPLEEDVFSFTYPASYGALRSAVLPGWGQWTLDRRGTGAMFLVSTVGLLGGAFYASNQAKAAVDDAYLAGTTEGRDQLVEKERDWKSRKNWLLAGAGIAWITNVLHGGWLSSHTPEFVRVELTEYPAVSLNVKF